MKKEGFPEDVYEFLFPGDIYLMSIGVTHPESGAPGPALAPGATAVASVARPASRPPQEVGKRVNSHGTWFTYVQPLSFPRVMKVASQFCPLAHQFWNFPLPVFLVFRRG